MVLEQLFCEERQKRLGFPCLERRLRGAMTKVYKVIAAVIKLTVDLSERSIHCKRWGSAMTLVGDWFKPEKKKINWNLLPQNVVEARHHQHVQKEADKSIEVQKWSLKQLHRCVPLAS